MDAFFGAFVGTVVAIALIACAVMASIIIWIRGSEGKIFTRRIRRKSERLARTSEDAMNLEES